MVPTLEAGDYLVIESLTYRRRQPRRGEVVILEDPRQPNRHLVKRVVGLPGEQLEIEEGRLLVDGREVAEGYVRTYWSGTWKPPRIPAGQYCVLGDNRPKSRASETWGFVPRSRILGRMLVSFTAPWSRGLRERE